MYNNADCQFPKNREKHEQKPAKKKFSMIKIYPDCQFPKNHGKHKRMSELNRYNLTLMGVSNRSKMDWLWQAEGGFRRSHHLVRKN